MRAREAERCIFQADFSNPPRRALLCVSRYGAALCYFAKNGPSTSTRRATAHIFGLSNMARRAHLCAHLYGPRCVILKKAFSRAQAQEERPLPHTHFGLSKMPRGAHFCVRGYCARCVKFRKIAHAPTQRALPHTFLACRIRRAAHICVCVSMALTVLIPKSDYPGIVAFCARTCTAKARSTANPGRLSK